VALGTSLAARATNKKQTLPPSLALTMPLAVTQKRAPILCVPPVSGQNQAPLNQQLGMNQQRLTAARTSLVCALAIQEELVTSHAALATNKNQALPP